MLHNKPNSELLKEMNRYVIGHERAKKTLISLVNRSKMAHYRKYLAPMYGEEEADVATSSCLLVGGSGTGKTYLIRTLQHIVEFPLIYIDATRLEPAGGTSSFDSKAILDLIMNNAKDLVSDPSTPYHSIEGTIDQTIVFVDEVDKLAKAFESSGNWNQQIQAGLLSILESNEGYDKVSFILAGAFADMTAEVPESASIGFHAAPKQEIVSDVTDRDVIRYGLKPELVGRLSNIVKLDKLDEKAMRKILVDVLLPAKIKEMELLGINASNVLDKAEIDTIVKISVESGQGVRALKRELGYRFNDLEFDYEDNIIEQPKVVDSAEISARLNNLKKNIKKEF